MSRTNVYRNGRVHVRKTLCATCIFREGNLMHLDEGRVEGMVRDASDSGCIPCHELLDGDHSVCRGFFNQHRNMVLQVAQRLGVVEYTP